MIISREYLIEPKTSLSNKTSDIVKLGKGTLRKVSFHSAPGVNGEIYVRIIHFENSIVPDESGQWITLTGARQEYQLHYNDWNEVPMISVEICAPEAKFSHRINVEMETEEELTLPQLFKAFIKGGLKSQIP